MSEKNLSPIALIVVSDDGIPSVFTQFDKGTMKKIYKLLHDSEGTYFN